MTHEMNVSISATAGTDIKNQKATPTLPTLSDGVTSLAVGSNPAREEWLYRVAEALYPKFIGLGHQERPHVRIGVGYPSTGAKGKAIGQCHDSSLSKDKVFEITISPMVDDTVEIAGILAHELCHAYLLYEFPAENCGHGKKFKHLAVSLGLTGRMTATVPGEAFKRSLHQTFADLGDYPHGALRGGSSRKVQGTRLVKVSCPSCRYAMRVTHKWIDVAIPTCPAPECELFNEQMEVAL